MSSPKVFLCYVTENKDSIKQLDEDLTDYGIEVIVDYKYVSGGDNFRDRIRNLIYQSGYFIPCFSKEFNRRKESVAYSELDYAIERGQDLPFNCKWIIPVRINECTIPSRRIRPGELLTDLHRIDLFPNAKWDQGIKDIVKALGIEPVKISENMSHTTRLRTSLTASNMIEVLQGIGFDMRRYTPLDPYTPTEYWAQSEWFIVTPENFPKLPNYITAIVSGTQEGILNEMRLSLSINDHSEKDNAYDSLIEKCNQLSIELCELNLPNEIIDDLIQAKNSFTDDRRFRPHAIYTDNDYRLEGINVNMHNEVYNTSPLDEKPVRFGFHITRFSFTL